VKPTDGVGIALFVRSAVLPNAAARPRGKRRDGKRAVGRRTRRPGRRKSQVIPLVILIMGQSTRVTEKGQATIPKELREKYNLEPGDEVVWIDTDEGIVVKKRTRTAGRGLLLPDDAPEDTREAVAEELGERLRERRDRNYEEA